MEVRSMQGSLRGFGAKSTVAHIELNSLSLPDRVKRAATIFGLGVVMALIAIPIPLVHFVLVPGALLAGAVLAIAQIGSIRGVSNRHRALSILWTAAEPQRDGP